MDSSWIVTNLVTLIGIALIGKHRWEGWLLFVGCQPGLAGLLLRQQRPLEGAGGSTCCSSPSAATSLSHGARPERSQVAPYRTTGPEHSLRGPYMSRKDTPCR
jgi:hypothetical protein